jgi:hypothetical protein
MDAQAIFALQFTISVVLFALLAKWEFAPRLAKLSPADALFWLVLPHAFRHMGMVFLVPGVIYEPLPGNFAIPAAYGDLAAGLLALGAIFALRSRWAFAIPAVWLFNVVGTVDLLNALSHFDVAPSLGAAWFIPTLFVPLLLVTHTMIFARLLRGIDRIRAAEPSQT